MQDGAASAGRPCPRIIAFAMTVKGIRSRMGPKVPLVNTTAASGRRASPMLRSASAVMWIARKGPLKQGISHHPACSKIRQRFLTNFGDNAYKIGTAAGGIGFKLGAIALSGLTSIYNR